MKSTLAMNRHADFPPFASHSIPRETIRARRSSRRLCFGG
jgi:hypothetical protein